MLDAVIARRAAKARLPFSILSLALTLALPTTGLVAQNIVSVPFTNGFIGNRGSSAGSSNAVLSYATLGIARAFFIQSSSSTSFELQGNDIPGTLRFVRTNGTTLDMPASANWRNSGGSTYLIGILPRPVSPITYSYAGGSIQITDGSAPGGSSVGGYVAGYVGTVIADGGSESGNAASSQVLAGLNSYLATVLASRPAGPVTVQALTTTSTTPTITGTATVGAGENLTVVVNGVQYSAGSSPAVVRSGTAWSLTMSTPLTVGTFGVTATITNADGFTLSDGTSNELVIASPGSVLTIGGSFTATDKVFDGSTVATGATFALTLLGINGGHQVTIATVTLAFQTATVGTGKTVSITAITLGGADAGLYTVNLAGVPTATASITAPPGGVLTIGGSFTATDKVFDGSTTAAGATGALTLLGINGVHQVTITSVTLAFQTADTGSSKSVVITAVILGGTDAGLYTVNLAGAPVANANITPGAAPTAPQQVTSNPGDRSINATWIAPQTPGCQTISGYVVEYSIDDGATWTRATVTGGSATSATLNGLANNFPYRVRIAAENSCGISVFAQAPDVVVPIGVTTTGGTPVTTTPGAGTSTTNGVTQPLTTQVVQDTTLHMSVGPVALTLRADDAANLAIPIDSSNTVLLEQGGSTNVAGTGFAPRTVVTVYAYRAGDSPLLLGQVTVSANGTFATSMPIPAMLAPGSYTLQVNGIDVDAVPRSAALGVEITEPPPDLVITSETDKPALMVGDTATITIDVKNQGTGPATDVVIPRAFEEPNIRILSTTPVHGTYDDVTHAWTIRRIEAGASARMLLRIVIIATAPAPTPSVLSSESPAAFTAPGVTP